MATKTYTYLGPADAFHLKEGGKAYHVGDEIPMSQEQAEVMRAAGHRFEELEPKPGEPYGPRAAALGVPAEALAAQADAAAAAVTDKG